MCRLFEAIQARDGALRDLRFHNERCNRSRRDLFGCADEIDLGERIVIPAEYRTGRYKCRVVYDREIVGVEFIPYRMRTIHSLQLVFDDAVDYRYKYDDKSALLSLAAHRGGCDDVIIVKNGCITDTSFSNLAFLDGGSWITPSTPLLAGTKRAKLIEAGELRCEDIRPDDLRRFSKVAMINAMIDPGEMELPVKNIR